MAKKNKKNNKGKGAEKTAMKTDKKAAAKQKKLLEKIGEDDIVDVVSKLEAEEARLQSVTETVCQAPSPRSSFTLVSHPDKEEIILFGGEFFNGQRVVVYNELFFYNINKNEWKQVRSPSGPAPRSGHQMVSLATDGGQLWLFGGEHASPSQLQFYHYKDLWCMSLKTNKWQKIEAPNGPSARSGHRMVAAKKRLIVFGGFHDNNQSYKYFNDVYVFSLETYTWLTIEIEKQIIPPPRSGCCICASTDGKVLIWGGYSKAVVKKGVDRGVTHTDMYALIPDKTNALKLKWSVIKPGGYKPLPRSSVGFTAAPNGKIYCFGGVMDIDEDEEDITGQFGNDLLSLDSVSHTWRLLEITKKVERNTLDDTPQEKPEQLPTATTSSDGVFTVTVGGPSVSHSLAKVIATPRDYSKPLPRMSPGLTVCKGKLYMYGGIFEANNKQHTLGDFYSLDLHKLDEWKVIIPHNLEAHDWIDSDDSSSDEECSEEDSDMEDDDEDDDSDMDTD